MNYFLLLVLFAIAASTSSIPKDERVNGENGWYVPRVDGSFEWVDMDEAESYLESMEKMEGRLSLNPVNFYLYTKSNPSTAHEIIATTTSIDASNFNSTNPTRVTIHGWTSSKSDVLNSGARQAWFIHGEYNMITIDWARARSFDYASSVLAVPGVGQKIAALIDFLVKNYGMKLEDLEIVGHSLGAHVAGFTGKNIASGKAHAIIGLDTALPLYSYDKPAGRLSNNDGYYVESIHTNGGMLGFLQPIGRGAFYPNGGQSQPGCGTDLTGGCAHGRAVSYFIEAIALDTFVTIECVIYQDAVDNNCGSTISSVRMGAVTNAFMASGYYFVLVNSASPFGTLV